MTSFSCRKKEFKIQRVAKWLCFQLIADKQFLAYNENYIIIHTFSWSQIEGMELREP